jgi:ArsR family transcriptional regulator, virulence genes transcriptional regulator
LIPNRSRERSGPLPEAGIASELDPKAEAAADLLKAMANPQRLRVLCLLQEGELSVGQINEQVGLSQSALSQHLGMLRERNLVSTRREAQTVFYSVSAGPVRDIIRILHAIYCAQATTTHPCDKERESDP